jgi:hypothetical protein
MSGVKQDRRRALIRSDSIRNAAQQLAWDTLNPLPIPLILYVLYPKFFSPEKR